MCTRVQKCEEENVERIYGIMGMFMRLQVLDKEGSSAPLAPREMLNKTLYPSLCPLGVDVGRGGVGQAFGGVFGLSFH